MKKLSKEENRGLELAKKKAKIFILQSFLLSPYYHNKKNFSYQKKVYNYLIIFLFFNQIVKAQIPINGFCKYESFDVQSNYTNLFSLNFNKDSYTDLFIFSDSSKNINSIKGLPNEKFQSVIKFNFIYKTSKIIPVTDKYNNVIEYAFLSKEKKIFGLVKFNNLGALELNYFIKLQFTPNQLSAADIDNDGKNEFLISGVAYEGLTIIKNDGSRLIKSDFENEHIYSQSVLIDLNNDGFYDIATFDIQYNQIKFFYNRGNGEFYFVRSFQLNNNISSLHSFDFNLDGYNDLIYTFENYFYVLFGDSIASFNNQITIKTNYNLDKIVLRDFNKDGKIDIAYLNKKNSIPIGTECSIVSVLFQNVDNKFYNEIKYLQKENLTDIIPFSSRYVDGLMSLSKDGKIYLISTLSSFRDYTKISFGDEPSTITYFDFNTDGIIDIAYTDKSSKSLRLIIRNQNGIPNLFYSFFVYENFSNIISYDATDNYKIFFLFNDNDNKFLMVEYDFIKNKFNRKYLYLNGTLKDLKIIKEKNLIYPKIYLTFTKNNKLNLSTYLFQNGKYEISNINNLDVSVFDAKFIDDQNLFYWKNSFHKEKEDQLELYTLNFQNGIKKNKIYSLNKNKNFSLKSFVYDIFNLETPTLISFYKDETNNFILLSNKSNMLNAKNYFVRKYRFNNNDFMNKISEDEKSFISSRQLFFGEFRPQNLKKLFLYLPFNNSIYSLTFLKNRNRVIIREIDKTENLYSFFIKRMSAHNFYIVYSDGKDNCIILKKL